MSNVPKYRHKLRRASLMLLFKRRLRHVTDDWKWWTWKITYKISDKPF